jgi:hypothetical protein
MKHFWKLLLTGAALLVVAFVSIVSGLRMYRSSPNVRLSHDAQRISSSMGTIVQPLNLTRLVNQSDVIVVGKVLEVSNERPSQVEIFHPYEVTLRVDRVVKGSLPPSVITVEFFRSPGAIAKGKSIASSLYAMFFLKEESAKPYALADSTLEALVAVEGAPAVSGDALTQVVDVLAHVLRSSDSSAADQLQAVDALASVDSQLANEALHLAVGSANEDLKLHAEVALLRHNDVSVLKLVEGTLMNPTNNASAAATVGRLSFAIQLGVRDPSGIPILTHLLGAPDPQVRRAAAHALRETRALASVGPLSTALNDTDQMVRYDAVLGLSEITGDRSHAPSVDAFKRDEAKYLKYWQKRDK